MSQLKIRNLVKDFGTAHIIRGIDLDIKDGDFVVFVGPSGCGKSTILRMIAGLESITDGTVEIDCKIVNVLPPVKRDISMVFQNYALYPHLTVYENIAFPLRVAKMDQAEMDRRVDYAAKVLQLEEHLQHRPGALSGGQRQRVAIGRSIVREPKVFLFDEPLSNLDAALRADMRIELAQLHKTLESTMIYVTHDQIEAMTMASKIVVLRDGLIEQVGSPLDLYYKPINKFVAGFIGSPTMNFIGGKFENNNKNDVTISIAGNNVTIPVRNKDVAVGSPVELGIRPEDIYLGEGEITITLKVNAVEHLGSTTVIYGKTSDTNDPIRVVLSNTIPVQSGNELKIGLNAEDCHLFDDQENAFARKASLDEFKALPESVLKG